MHSPKLAPNFQLYRSLDAADSALPEDRSAGINCSGYRKLLVQVVPGSSGGGSDVPVVTVYTWTEADGGKWIAFDPALDFGPPTAGEGFQFSVDCEGQDIYLDVRGATVDETEVHVAVFVDIG